MLQELASVTGTWTFKGKAGRVDEDTAAEALRHVLVDRAVGEGQDTQGQGSSNSGQGSGQDTQG